MRKSVTAGVVLGFGCLTLYLASVANRASIPRGVAVAQVSTPTASTHLPYVCRAARVQEVRVLPNHFAFEDDYGDLHIVGEVRNDTVEHVRSVRLPVVVYNGDGKIIDTATEWLSPGDLPSGERTCFEIEFYGSGDWAYYEFEGPIYDADGDSLPDLSILNDWGYYDQGDYKILGQVRNDHGTVVNSVEVVTTLYDAAGTVLGCGLDFVNDPSLDPGQVSAFKAWFWARDYADVASYRLQAAGQSE